MRDRDRGDAALSALWTSVIAALLVAAAFVASGAGQSVLRRDEVHFWPTSLRFSEEFLPSLATLADYGELNTPLAFVLFGWVEALTGGGVVAGRVVNAACAWLMLLVIAFRRGRVSIGSASAALGLAACPYFLGVSVHVYPDTIASLCALLGIVAFNRGSHGFAALAFALGIATRQYVVAFPVACAILLLVRREARVALPAAVGVYLLSCATLLGWFALFGGFAPRSALTREAPATTDWWYLRPQHGLYLLACVGLYYVLVEAALFGGLERWRALLREARLRSLIVAVGLAGLFMTFPPLGNVRYGIAEMGLLDVGARSVLPDSLRLVAFYLLALLACWRFRRMSLAGMLVGVHAVLMLKAHIAWDKYAVSLLVVLWYLRGESSEADATGAPGLREVGLWRYSVRQSTLSDTALGDDMSVGGQ